MLEALNLGVRRGSATLLADVSLAVAPGELLAVVGPNGAGKSTLLRVLGGEWRAESGEARVLGRPLGDWPAEHLARRRAVLPQHSGLSFGFTAAEVVAMGRYPHRGTPAAAWDRHAIAEALAATGVAHLAGRRFPTLSGGERQRVHLARALAQLWPAPSDDAARRERLLLLDEPTASQDPAHQHAVLGLARQWADAGCAVLAVLHDLALAAQYADRIAVLCRGRLMAVGTPHEILTPAMMEAAFDLRVGPGFCTAALCALKPVCVTRVGLPGGAATAAQAS